MAWIVRWEAVQVHHLDVTVLTHEVEFVIFAAGVSGACSKRIVQVDEAHRSRYRHCYIFEVIVECLLRRCCTETTWERRLDDELRFRPSEHKSAYFDTLTSGSARWWIRNVEG